VHGLAVWFDVLFEGQQQKVFLSTSPTEPLTHWYQVRCLLTTPLFVKQGYLLKGTVELLANKRQSYDVTIELCIDGHGDQIISSNNTYDLKNPYFRYSGAPGYTPGAHSSSPSEIWWNTLGER
jgi:type I protein arginine methyltransferase